MKQREKIPERDNWGCTKCGATPSNPAGTRLQIHHMHHIKDGGGNEDHNLVTLCAPCHAGQHAAGKKVEDELLNTGADPDA